jgi:filamentous hemagglutinin family protein
MIFFKSCIMTELSLPHLPTNWHTSPDLPRRQRTFRGPLAAASAIAAVMALPRYGLAGPTGGTVVGGAATISQSGSTTNINQSTNQAIINWQTFSIAPSETVNFYQPSITSVTLNRVIGNEQSVIAGALNANGQVFIINSAGIIFTKGAEVNVGGLVASTLDISNQDFMARNYSFSGTSSAAVINQGRIHANPGGYVALLGKTVSNDGVIVAKLGTVVMASGEKMTLNFSGNSLVDVTIDQGTLNALVENKGAIIANGGRVILTAKAADQVLSAQVNNSGIIQARTMASLKGGTRVVHQGSIKLLAQGGTVNVTGKLDASAPKGGNGGTIETSGDNVKIADSAIITTKSTYGQNGTWLIDPDGFTIAAVGGDISGKTLSAELGLSNITIASTSGHGTDGNINVNDTVTWSSGSTLTLNATNAINVNALISGPNGGLTLNAGTNININAPSSLQVATLNATAVAGDINFNAPQTWTNAGTWTFNGQNINVNDTVNWSAGTVTLNAGAFINLNDIMTASGAASLVVTYNTGVNTTVNSKGNPTAAYGTPLGGINPLFDPSTGTYTGKINFTNDTAASPLTINGQTYTLITSIAQLIAVNGNNAGNYALATDIDAGGTTYSSSLITTLNGNLEGLGHNISNLTISTTAVGSLGLIGANNGTVRDLSLTGVSVTATRSGVGSLVGTNNRTGNIINVAASGSVTVDNVTLATGGFISVTSVGGLVGSNSGIIYGAWANVGVNATNVDDVGGLVGLNTGTGVTVPAIISNSTSIGSVSLLLNDSDQQLGGIKGTGGLVGANRGGTLSGDASSSVVTVQTAGSFGALILDVGGLVGTNTGSTLGFGGSVFNSSATGKIINNGGDVSFIGGFVGNNTGTISNSFSSTAVPFPGGGFAGSNVGGTFIGDTWNPGTAAQTSPIEGSGSTSGLTTTTATGPSSTQGPPPSGAPQQAASARSQAQALAQQAAAQQAAAGRAQTGGDAASAGATGTLTAATTNPPSNSMSAAGTAAASVPSAVAINSNLRAIETSVQADDQRIRRRVIAAAQAAPRRINTNGGDATIRNLEINGKRIRVPENSNAPGNNATRGAPGQNPQ